MTDTLESWSPPPTQIEGPLGMIDPTQEASYRLRRKWHKLFDAMAELPDGIGAEIGGEKYLLMRRVTAEGTTVASLQHQVAYEGEADTAMIFLHRAISLIEGPKRGWRRRVHAEVHYYRDVVRPQTYVQRGELSETVTPINTDELELLSSFTYAAQQLRNRPK